jgi:hypothetical protein
MLASLCDAEHLSALALSNSSRSQSLTDYRIAKSRGTHSHWHIGTHPNTSRKICRHMALRLPLT